ncbi:MAG TPA: DUF5985 family protein [Verrucomicrobiae bacterium]|nr:DUF5985 family protein [Verrucomicrobiae bacterium]
MAEVVYLLCALTSVSCTVLLMRGYRRTGLPLLFWSSVAFLAFAVANSLLFVDLVLLPETVNLLVWRQASNLAGVVLLLNGLIRTHGDL